jgi:AcrR family transcriptional regulator
MRSERPPSSFRSMADAAGVSVPTLRHYFADREGAIGAVLADAHFGGRRMIEVARTPTGEFDRSIRDLVTHIVGGFRFGGLVDLNALGITEGLGSARLAKAYLDEILEPTIQASADQIAQHVARGEIRDVDPRHAAIALISPLLILFLHQNRLGGSKHYPTDMDRFVAVHTEAFIAGYRAK